MITLKRLNVERQVATEEQADKLVKQGFTRIGGTAEGAANVTVTEADLAKMGEAMYEKLSKTVKEAVAKATTDKGKPVKGGDKEGQDGNGTDQPDSGDGAKQPEAAK